MTRIDVLILCLLSVSSAHGINLDNATSPISRQLLEFKLQHPKPIGLLTLDTGCPVDIRDTMNINSDLYKQDFFLNIQTHIDRQRVQERTVGAKGLATWGYFEVTNDVSKYTSADVFNGIGKKTPVLGRFGVGNAERGGGDLVRQFKTSAIKFYTKEGNLDFLSVQLPTASFRDVLDFPPFVQSIHRNQRTGLPDTTMLFDVACLRPASLPTLLGLYSDFGMPDGWRHSNFFTAHAFEVVNKHGERWYVKFNWRTEQGFEFLTGQQIRQIQRTDADYYLRDMVNAIETKNFPSWRLEMDVLSLHDIQTADFDPFDITAFWKNGSYATIPIGRLVINQISDNQFRDGEQAAFNPANLVPGIPGPVDNVFRGRRFAYKDTQNYRLGVNHNKIGVNAPLYPAKTYNRNGHPPVLENMKDAPTYYPNSFNGPIPFVDDRKPQENLRVLSSFAADLQQAEYFYNNYLPNDASRQRLSENLAEILLNNIIEPTKSRCIRLFKLVDVDLFRQVVKTMKQLVKNANKLSG